MKDLGKYTIKPFSKVRRILSEFNTIASQNPNVLGLIEVQCKRKFLKNHRILNC